jgi:exodeoxyribonuclease VII small subunit
MPRKSPSPSTPAPDEPLPADLTFEAAFAELEAIVTQLEQGELPLEQSLTLHARGQRLAAFCGQQLDQAELKVREIRD